MPSPQKISENLDTFGKVKQEGEGITVRSGLFIDPMTYCEFGDFYVGKNTSINKKAAWLASSTPFQLDYSCGECLKRLTRQDFVQLLRGFQR